MAEANLPYTFTNGTGNIIDATQVNANFEELEDSVNDVDKDQLESSLADKLGVSSTATVRRGKCIVATEETTTSTSYTLLSTPDRVQNVVLPADGLIFVVYRALTKGGAGTTESAAIFVGSNQLKQPEADSVPVVQAAAPVGGFGYYGQIHSFSGGLTLGGFGSLSDTSSVTTGQTISHQNNTYGGACIIEAAAGTYDISVRFKTPSGTLYAKERKLWVWTQAF